MKNEQIMMSACACGRVELEARGKPLASSVCYCADCRKGAAEIEALPDAKPVREPDGGTSYILFRKDRIGVAKGADLLKPYKLRAASVTNRVVASCCNTAMMVNFDRGPHWVSAYHARFRGALPPLEMRVCTKSKLPGTVLPDDVPSYETYPLGMMLKLLASRVAMLIGR